jgi:hypothetical protein
MQTSVQNLVRHLLTLIFVALVCIPELTYAQCGITIPTGQHCSPPPGTPTRNCFFFECDSSGNCVITSVPLPPGTKCGLFGDQCFDDFCDGLGNCNFSFNIAPNYKPCASEVNVCDGVSLCDGIDGLGCTGDTIYPAAGCDDGILCTEDCNPIDTCVTYPFNNRCDDSDICTLDICDTTGTTAGCTHTCSGVSGCASNPACSTFPVELVNFSAQLEGRRIWLEWMTVMEVNNRGFDVEVSSDGEVFEKQGFVQGGGTISDAQFYDFRAEIVAFGSNYIRLKQWDTEGGFSYSNTLHVFAPQPIPFKLEQAYPNPFSQSTLINFSVGWESKVSLVLYNHKGVKIKTLFSGVADPTQMYQVRLSREGLIPGMYFYRLEGEHLSKAQKITLHP